ncbi:uncharacterized protein TNCV_471701 [Trichonephila clavipes]|uniref:Uncharacterized protein n=1 Tax=Trichonephila clavipes TaxID=2585209 RepID=A0A8X6RI65_TRICX|nr:uncharacterized protein TNCV_471701 [Trichonephila clavipes]
MDALPEAMGALPHFFPSPFDNIQVEIRPSLDSLQSFSYQDYVKNLKHSHSLLEEDENWDHSDIVRVPHDELEQFIKVHLVKDYLERENHGWYLVIGATDLATYMYLDRIIPEVMQYVGKEHHAETVVHDMMKRYRWREEDPANM